MLFLTVGPWVNSKALCGSGCDASDPHVESVVIVQAGAVKRYVSEYRVSSAAKTYRR